MTRSELIAALEKADGPSRELDSHVALLSMDGWVYDEPGYVWQAGCGSISSQSIKVRSYTSSIDAALTLVPGTVDWCLELNPESGFHANVWSAERGWNYGASVINAAIALCIAALKAIGENE